MDREKVIKGLEMLRFFNQRAGRELWADKPHDIQETDIANADAIYANALALLKEQEPIMIKAVMINGSGRNGRCQNCLMMLNEMDYPNFCGNCGQKVKWE